MTVRHEVMRRGAGMSEPRRRSYEPRFHLGDQVYAIVDQWTKRIVNCFTCSHTGQVKIGDEVFECPKCHGASRHPQFAGNKWVVCETGKVGRVEITHTDPRYCRDGAEPLEVRYMIDSTGVGSGTVWEQSRLWPSREAAQAECDRRNSNTNWEDDPEAEAGAEEPPPPSDEDVPAGVSP